MKIIISVSHQVIDLRRSFEDFTTALEGLLVHFDPASLDLTATDPQRAEQQLAALGSYENLTLFGVQNHGELFRLLGAPKKAKQYAIGNPLVALQMTQHDLRAALYAPLRVLVYEAENQQARVEYDLPSSLFGQFQNAAVTEVAQGLDAKLLHLVHHADTSA
ncbi:DUF302 domain-containing protein [Hymenobacter negativus]|uniref:DUF302 domain-containing protein n=1 Tax=Hymenobacter negativus TaxID=2795026 RepID=A0ABS3QJZ4_9BACT|nr:DUF302 domain-containing protein [Hymenobacter negativus]MBO2011580.1 DUF302 domain-containing protein [Hymenobacter negativus]